jgi:hypothetical protein
MAQGRKTKLSIELTNDEREILESWQRSSIISAELSRRSRLVLLLSRRHSVSETAKVIGISRRQDKQEPALEWLANLCSHIPNRG